jgi:hypothetical protein
MLTLLDELIESAKSVYGELHEDVISWDNKSKEKFIDSIIPHKDLYALAKNENKSKTK